MLLHVRRSGWRYRPRMARTKPAASMIRTTTSPNAAMPSNVTVTETAPRLPAMAPISTRAKHASTPRKPLRISLVDEVSMVATAGGWASPPHYLYVVSLPNGLRLEEALGAGKQARFPTFTPTQRKRADVESRKPRCAREDSNLRPTA